MNTILNVPNGIAQIIQQYDNFPVPFHNEFVARTMVMRQAIDELDYSTNDWRYGYDEILQEWDIMPELENGW